ncbi:MAG: hypothetical protein PVH74_05190 [Desulfobacterales bacterium]|jgi:hypothetical protein
MAKIKKRRLKWTASDSAQVVGYKLYWSEGSEVNYDSKCVTLGNIAELILPDDVDVSCPLVDRSEAGVEIADKKQWAGGKR